jgi:hypothetical protein
MEGLMTAQVKRFPKKPAEPPRELFLRIDDIQRSVRNAAGVAEVLHWAAFGKAQAGDGEMRGIEYLAGRLDEDLYYLANELEALGEERS